MKKVRYPVTFQPMGLTCRISHGTTIMEAASEQGVAIRSDCGGRGKCGQCTVGVMPGEQVSALTQAEIAILPPHRLSDGVRLACRTKIQGPVSVFVTDHGQVHTETIVRDHDAELFTSRRRPARGQGRETAGSWGVAVDIGTTTLGIYLGDLDTGQVLISASAANPQCRYGEDVISRISHCSEAADGLGQLRRILIETINTLISRCLEELRIDARRVDDVIVVGNTTMQHIFSGLHPENLGVSPHAPVSREGRDIRAPELGLSVVKNSTVHVFPMISGFIGGDTLSVILFDKPHERNEISLIIDIGTNGEIVLGNKETLWVTSCATGPALEGAHIRHGVRAMPGAIERVYIEPSTCHVTYEVAGEDQSIGPIGICGSGIIDTVAEMLRVELILPSGRLREGRPGIISDERGIGRTFIMVPAGSISPSQPEISITLEDIRQVQLAKAALAAGIELLMKRSGISTIDRFVLTGAFGARFNWKNGVALGLLPKEACRADVLSLLHGAGRGALTALFDTEARERIQAVARSTHVLELSGDPDFLSTYVDHIPFPDASPC